MPPRSRTASGIAVETRNVFRAETPSPRQAVSVTGANPRRNSSSHTGVLSEKFETDPSRAAAPEMQFQNLRGRQRIRNRTVRYQRARIATDRPWSRHFFATVVSQVQFEGDSPEEMEASMMSTKGKRLGLRLGIAAALLGAALMGGASGTAYAQSHGGHGGGGHAGGIHGSGG